MTKQTEKNNKTQGGPQAQSQEIAKIEKNIADNVLHRVQTLMANKDIRLPGGFVPENALKSAWLVLLETKDRNGNPVLQTCTRESIANALFNMAIQGLSPVKKQCDFIAYGDKLIMQREYHGTIALAKRYGGVQEAVGNVVYESDEFEYSIDEKGYKKVTKHLQELENIDVNKIKGAYATLIFEDHERPPYTEIMTIAQIKQSWMQGATKGASPAHKNFPDQMAIKTVISRACKLFISSSDDSALFDEGEETDPIADARAKIQAHANREEITLDAKAEEVKDQPADQPSGPGPETPEPVDSEAGPGKIPGF